MKINRNVLSRISGCVCTALLTLCTISANAQQAEQGEGAQIISFTANEGLRAEDAGQILAKRLQCNPATDELRSAYILNPGDGIQVQRFNQYYKGIRVEHGTYTLTSKNGVASYAFGKFYPTAAIAGTTPAMDEATALKKALDITRAEKYAWETGTAKYPKATLSLIEDFSSGDGDGVLHLAYAFDIYAEAPLSRNMMYIDASTGKLLFMDAILKHFVAASGKSLYSDTVSFNGGLINGLVHLHDSTRGNGIFTYNLNHATNPNSAVEVTSTTSFFAQDPAVDAHWGAKIVYDYWKSAHNRNSWDGLDGELVSFVHYGNSYDNASWNGSYMIYGDGSGVSAGRFPPLTALDVCAHEIGHGVCQSTANLVYSRESGAMNEGFSDIWGAVVEAYGDPHENDAIAKNPWLIGEELTNTLRSMSNPKQFGQPDTYLGANWVYTGPGCATSNDNCGVHANSGVLNHWFYLLTMGGKGTNDVDNKYDVTGVAMTKAAKIAYNTEITLSRTATYANARTASIAAATALYGACSPETEAVIRAWYAVGVGGNYVSCIPQVSFNGETSWINEDAAIDGCRPSHIVSVPVSLSGSSPLAGDSAQISIIVAGGTAVAGVDYDLLTPTVTFYIGGAATQSISFRVYDNGVPGTNKYIDLTYNLVAGSSNAVRSPFMDTTRVTLSDDDYVPYAGGDEQRVVLNYNAIANASSPFFSSALGAHCQYLYRVKELLAAGVHPGVPITEAGYFIMSKISTQAFTGYTMKLAHTQETDLTQGIVTTGFTTVFSDSLTTQNLGWSSIPFSTPFTWNGVDNLVVEVCFANSSAGSGNDRVQAQSGTYAFAATASSAFNPGCSVPLTVNNLINNRPVIQFTQKTPVETALNGTRTWEVKDSNDVYFYSAGAKKLIAAILQPSDSLGCVTATVTSAGNGSRISANGLQRSVKEFSIIPGRQPGATNCDVVIYFSNDELAGISRGRVKIVQTSSADDNSITAGNTKVVTPASVIYGLDYTGFRATFSEFGRFFLEVGDALSVGGPVAQSSELWTGENPFHTTPVLHWNLANQERVNIRLYDITGKLVYGSEQTLAAGNHQTSLTVHADLAPGTYVLQVVRPSGVFTRQLVKQ